MNQSETIDALAQALVKAQAEIEVAKRQQSNPFFKSRYADLEAVWAVARGPLTKNGLAIVQTLSGTVAEVTVTTRLLHQSGQWIEGSLTLKPVKADPQGMGSAITYGRRYSLAAIAGVVVQGEDDDANGASGKLKSRAGTVILGQAVEPVPPSERIEPSPEQKKLLWAMIRLAELETDTDPEGHTVLYMPEEPDGIVLRDLDRRALSALIDRVRALASERDHEPEPAA